jgi:hypothetical protein
MTHPSGRAHEGALGGSARSSIRAPATAAERLQALLRPLQEAKV